MKNCSIIRALAAVAVVLPFVSGFAAGRDRKDVPKLRPAAVSPSVKSEMARYSLSAFE